MTILPNGNSFAFHRELEALHKAGIYDYNKHPVPVLLKQQSPQEFIEEYYEKNKPSEYCLDYGDSVKRWTNEMGGWWDGNFAEDYLFSEVALHCHVPSWGAPVYEMPWGDVYVRNPGCGECEGTLCHFKNINDYLQQAWKQ